MKKIYNSAEKFEVLKFILPVEINLHDSSTVSRLEMKNLQRSEQAHFLVSQLHRSISVSLLCHCACAFAPITILNHLVNSISSNLRILSVKKRYAFMLFLFCVPEIVTSVIAISIQLFTCGYVYKSVGQQSRCYFALQS